RFKTPILAKLGKCGRDTPVRTQGKPAPDGQPTYSVTVRNIWFASVTRGGLRDFAHLDVGHVLGAKGLPRLIRPAALFPVGPDAEGPAFDACDHVKNRDGDGSGHHENGGRDHAEYREDEKQDAADNLIKCIHRID